MNIRKSIAFMLAVLIIALMTACGAKPAPTTEPTTEPPVPTTEAAAQETEPAAQMVNPITEVTADEMAQKTGVKLSALAGAENVRYSVINGEPAVAQVIFDLAGREYVYRGAVAQMDATALSGVYFGSCTEEPIRVAFAEGKLLTEGKTVVVFWEDASAAISYSFACMDCDDPAAMKGFANSLFTADRSDAADIAGIYKDENYDDVMLTKEDDGSFSAVVGIFRLSTFEGTGILQNGSVALTLADPAGGTLYAVFSCEDDGSCTLTIVDSAWSLLETGTVFEGFVKDSVG